MRIRIAILCVALGGHLAVADAPRFIGGHLAYAVGGAPIGGGDGARHTADAGIAFGWMAEHGNRDGLWSSHDGIAVAASVVTGFSATPTYVMAGVGKVVDTSIAGSTATLDLVVRVDPSVSGGLGVRLAGDIAVCQLGLRAFIVGSDPELVLLATFGFGRF